jgi:hypothetical protein
MLNVSFNLAAVAAMLLGIVEPGHRIEVDSLNSPTTRPIPGGSGDLVTWPPGYKWDTQKNLHRMTPKPTRAPARYPRSHTHAKSTAPHRTHILQPLQPLPSLLRRADQRAMLPRRDLGRARTIRQIDRDIGQHGVRPSSLSVDFHPEVQIIPTAVTIRRRPPRAPPRRERNPRRTPPGPHRNRRPALAPREDRQNAAGIRRFPSAKPSSWSPAPASSSRTGGRNRTPRSSKSARVDPPPTAKRSRQPAGICTDATRCANPRFVC